MLVLDSARRLTIAQVSRHRWLQQQQPPSPPPPPPPPPPAPAPCGEVSEHVLRVMQGLGIDTSVTRQVSHTPGHWSWSVASVDAASLKISRGHVFL